MMKRRDSIKSIILGSIGASLTMKSCITQEDEILLNQVWKYNYGRTSEELKWDYKVLTGKFFSNNERKIQKRVKKYENSRFFTPILLGEPVVTHP